MNPPARLPVPRPRPAANKSRDRDRAQPNPKPDSVARRRSLYLRSMSAAFVVFAASVAPSKAAPADDERAIAALDTQFQLAVKNNDAVTIDRILAPDMVLVTGRGKVYTRADHLEQARTRATTYDQQDEVPGSQKVRLFGRDTAIVTALLWIKGAGKDGKVFDYKVWFSDTYVRTPQGWRYAFGQSSIPLPKEEERKVVMSE